MPCLHLYKFCFFFFVAILTSALCGCSSSSSLKRPAITKLDPSKVVLSPQWSLKIDERKSPDDILPYHPQQFSNPALNKNGSVIYIGTQHSGFLALSSDNKKVLWSFSPEGESWSSEALVEKGIVYTGSNNGVMRALNAKTGEEQWAYKTKGAIKTKPILTNGKLIFTDSTGKIFALDAKSGEWLWHAGGERPAGKMSIDSLPAPLLMSDEAILTPFLDGSVGMLNIEDGAAVWRKKYGRAVDFRDISGLVKTADSLIVSVYNTGIFWIDAKTGEVKKEAVNILYPSALVFDGKNSLMTATGDGKIYLMNAGTGKIKWSYNFNSGFAGRPVFFDNFIIAGHSERGLFVLETPTGKCRQVLRPGYGILSKPAIADSSIILFSNGGYIYNLRSDTAPLAITN